MSRLKFFLHVTLLVSMLTVVGCNSQKSETAEPSPSSDPSSQAANPADDHGDHGDHNESAETDDVSAALASLPADDRESAMQQEICPVSGESLGSMGQPKKIDINGESVWICCDGCEDKLLAAPDKYLAKINES